MAKTSPIFGAYRPLVILAGLVLAVATLYWAQKLIVPFVLAVLLTFVLSPLVSLLQRRGLPRVLAAVLVVFVALLALAAIGSGLTLQVKRLSSDLPQYKNNITRKIAGVRGMGQGGWFQNLQDTFQEIAGPSDDIKQPLPVRVETSRLSEIEGAVGPAVESLATAGLVVVLVIFMLIQRESLRNRLVRLVPHGRLLATTRALTETAERLSRFLLMQLLVNAAYGLVVGVGLFFFGLPYALVWGIMAAFLRYLPFVGTILAIGLVVLFSVAVFPGWTQPLLILGFFVVVELIAANFVEPLLFGHSTGVSPLALIIAVAFWTWLWGPIGLVLSTPLTLCMLVFGRYIPNLESLGVLLGDEPALDPEINFYQRLLARDQDEATDLVEQFVQMQPPATVYDRVLLPALGLAKQDRESDELTPDAEKFIYQAIEEIVEYLAAFDPPSAADQEEAHEAEPAEDSLPKPLVFGCPARDEADRLSLQMLAQLLGPSVCRFEVIPVGITAKKLVSRVQAERPALVCIAALPPGGLAQMQYLCKRLRAEIPKQRILAGRWGPSGSLEEGLATRLRASGANGAPASLIEARDQIAAALQEESPPITKAKTVVQERQSPNVLVDVP
jgi:predicted PurR-regulated permease PerM